MLERVLRELRRSQSRAWQAIQFVRNSAGYEGHTSQKELSLVSAIQAVLEGCRRSVERDFPRILPKKIEFHWSLLERDPRDPAGKRTFKPDVWVTSEGRRIVIDLRPSDEWKKLLPRAVHRELIRVTRAALRQGKKQPVTLLEEIVEQGLAEAYVTEKFPESAPTTPPIDSDTVTRLLPRVSRVWESESLGEAERGYWIRGDGKRRIPAGFGTCLGLRIVQQKRSERPDLEWGDLIQLPTSEFLGSALH